jgi:hypothetical protein
MGWRWGVAAALLLAPVGVATAAAHADEMPTVTIESGPTTLHTLPELECTDAIESADEPREFIVTRDAPSPTALTVHYKVEPEYPYATSGVDYVPLSGVVTIPANVTSERVPLHPLSSSTVSKIGAIKVVLSPADNYTIGAASSVALRFAVIRDPELGPIVCDPAFQIADITTNREQTIHVGERPIGIVTTPGYGVSMRMLEGELPAGVSFLRGFSTGSDFVGAATTVGTTVAHIQVCTIPYVVTCRETTLVVHVVAGDGSFGTTAVQQPGELPRTGALPMRDLVIALSFIGLGVALLCKARANAALDLAHHHRGRMGSRAG